MLSKVDEKWRWKLRLFASADLVGSTAFKVTQSKNKTPDWASTFREFFNDFPTFLEKQYEQLSALPKRPSAILKPWKFLGDECLFEVELTNHKDAAIHALAFKSAIKTFPARWKGGGKGKDIPLLLKGTMWVAGFPVGNRELILRTHGRDITDYIGPSIDTGFRIAKYATERKIAISADMAYLLVHAVDTLNLTATPFKVIVGFSGCEQLKGVLEGTPYPAFYLHIFDGEQTPEEQLLKITHKTEMDSLKHYLLAFLKSHLHLPFLITDPNERFKDVPEDFEERRAAMIADEELREFAVQSTTSAPDISGEVTEPSGAATFICTGLHHEEEAKVSALGPRIAQKLIGAGIHTRICEATNYLDVRAFRFPGTGFLHGMAFALEFMLAESEEGALASVHIVATSAE